MQRCARAWAAWSLCLAAPGVFAQGPDAPPQGSIALTQTLDSPTGQPLARFGAALALSGDRLLVGAPDGDGAAPGSGVVFAYRADSRGHWQPAGTLTGSTVRPGADFGASVDVLGRLAVVGAPGSGPGGAVHVFLDAAGGWVEVQRIEPGVAAAAGASFGADLSIDARRGRAPRLLVGAPGWPVEFDGAPTPAGAAFEFDWTGPGFELRARLLARFPLAGADFGRAVALDGDLAVVAAPLARRPDDPGSAPIGTAHLFARAAPDRAGPGAGALVELQLLAPGYPLPGEDFAADVAVSGSTVAVAVPLRTVGGLSGIGAVLLFEPDALPGEEPPWRVVRELIAGNAKADDGFARAIALDGDLLLVGAPDTPDGGAVYAFGRDVGGPGAWGELGRLDNPTGTGDFLGQAVDLDGAAGAAGAPFADAPGASAAGRVEVLAVGG